MAEFATINTRRIVTINGVTRSLYEHAMDRVAAATPTTARRRAMQARLLNALQEADERGGQLRLPREVANLLMQALGLTP